MKCNCGESWFEINIEPDCSDCSHNGIYREHLGYVYEEPYEDEIRDQVYEEGECDLGVSFDCGCYQFKCVYCDKVTNLPVKEDD